MCLDTDPDIYFLYTHDLRGNQNLGYILVYILHKDFRKILPSRCTHLRYFFLYKKHSLRMDLVHTVDKSLHVGLVDVDYIE